MRNTTISYFAGDCHSKSAFHICATLLLVCCALALFGDPIAAVAQAPQDSAPAANKYMPPMPSAPSAGKALICIYRTGRFVGSASHDHLYVNGVYLATLLNGEYAWTEVPPGTVVVTGLLKMYYGGIIQSSAAAVNETTKKENERIRLDVEAEKTYYMKWTAEAFATGIKVALMDPAFGAKEMSKLHPSKPVEEKDEVKKEGK